MPGIWFVIYAAIMHILWGICLFIDARAGWTTPLHMLVQQIPGAWLLLLLAGLAVFAGMHPAVRRRAPGFFPAVVLFQQMLLMAQCAGQLTAVFLSQYADGVPRPQLFIFADQMPGILLTLFHTLALIMLYCGVGKTHAAG